MEKIAEYYKQSRADKSIEYRTKEVILDALGENLPTTANRVLQLGYGNGLQADFLIARYEKLTILEISHDLVMFAKNTLGDSVDVIETDFNCYETDLSFDLIVADNVLEHAEKPKVLLENLREMLTTNGELWVLVPNAFSLHRLFGVELGLLSKPWSLNDSDRAVGHLRVYTKDELSKELRSAGLRIKRWHPLFVKFLSSSQMSRMSKTELRALATLSARIPVDYGAILCAECVKN